MKKLILILAIAAVAGMALSAKTKTQAITYDPNDIIESPSDANNIIITVRVEITKDQFEAIQYLNISLTDVINSRRLSRTLDRLVVQAKANMTEAIDVNDLKTKLEE